MRWLIYGHKGWIGGQIKQLLEQSGQEIIDGKSRVDQYQQTLDEVKSINPDRIICSIGRTSGKDCSNIDYLEMPNRLPENLRDNLMAPLNLAQISQLLNIHLTYIGTGCIYEYDDEHTMINLKGYNEDDKPNFFGSQYSIVKGVTDQLIRRFNTVLNCRIRMPINNQDHPRNFITKITKYKKIISVPNSMTVLPDLLPIMIDMATKKLTGSINLTNPGVISHQEILDLYQKYVDPNFTYQIMPLEQLSKYTLAKRSNNCLDTTLLTSLYQVTPIYQSIIHIMKDYHH
ncbi:MAG: hypothetical protein ABIN35_00175 [candidate division WOR-3 bacterium]